MLLPSDDILKNLSEIIHPYAFVLAGTFALKNSLTCMSVTPRFVIFRSVHGRQIPRPEIEF